MIGTLYIVATPIGNLDDITFRAVEILRSADAIVCEDTRVTKKLLQHYEIDVKLMSYHHHSGEKVLQRIVQELQSGKTLAYVTDAGTPGISDPGNKLVNFIAEQETEIPIIPIPGASAVVTALSVSGFPTDHFRFQGFIPHKKGRKKFLEQIAQSKETVVFYESVHRIMKLLSEMIQILPERQMVIARELTKQYETLYRGVASEVRMQLNEDAVKGEFVVIVKGKK